MPLLRWPNGSSRPSAMGVDFLMMQRDGTTIRCRVLSRALKAILGGHGNLSREHLLVSFDRCRGKIESIASQKYDCGRIEHDVIVVHAEDVLQAGLDLNTVNQRARP